MGLPKIKFEKEKKPTIETPVLSIKVGVKQDARLDLGKEQPSISVTFIAPGLSAEAVTELLNAVGDDGFVRVQIMPREQRGKGQDHD